MRIPLLLVLTLLVAAPVFAQAGDAEEVAPPGADEYTQTVQTGIAAMVSGSSSAAVTAFQAAVQLDGARPMAPYYLAAAARVGGNFDEALQGFERAAALAQAAGEPRWQARALQGAASTLERMDGRLEDARTAWQEYVRFADSNSGVAFAALGRARVQAINVVTEQEVAYVQVRQRIAERERINAESSSGRRGR